MIWHGKSNTKTKFFAERIIRGESPHAGKVHWGENVQQFVIGYRINRQVNWEKSYRGRLETGWVDNGLSGDKENAGRPRITRKTIWP